MRQLECEEVIIALKEHCVFPIDLDDMEVKVGELAFLCHECGLGG